jgi:hypothetical protein
MPTTLTEDHNQSGVNTVSYSELVATHLKMDKLETKNGKKIDIVKNDRGDFLIQFATGGQTPKEFAGKFTTLRAVQEALVRYFSRNAQTKSDKTTD